MIHSSLGKKYIGLNKNYNKQEFNKMIYTTNKNTYKYFHNFEKDKSVDKKFIEQLDVLSNIVVDFSSSLNTENLFKFGNANIGLALASMVGQCNGEVSPMKFNQVPNSLISIDLKEISDKDLNLPTNYYKNELKKQYEYKKENKDSEIKPFEEDFFEEQMKLIDESKDEFRKTMISYLIVNMPEHELEFVFKDKADLERFKEIANERIKRAGGEIKEEATLNELSSTKKDDDRIPK